MIPSRTLSLAEGTRSAIGLPKVLGYRDEAEIINKMKDQIFQMEKHVLAKLKSAESVLSIQSPVADDDFLLKALRWESEKVTENLVQKYLDEGHVWLAKGETAADYAEQVCKLALLPYNQLWRRRQPDPQVKKNMCYVLDEEASFVEVRGNDGSKAHRDTGHHDQVALCARS